MNLTRTHLVGIAVLAIGLSLGCRGVVCVREPEITVLPSAEGWIDLPFAVAVEPLCSDSIFAPSAPIPATNIGPNIDIVGGTIWREDCRVTTSANRVHLELDLEYAIRFKIHIKGGCWFFICWPDFDFFGDCGTSADRNKATCSIDLEPLWTPAWDVNLVASNPAATVTKGCDPQVDGKAEEYIRTTLLAGTVVPALQSAIRSKGNVPQLVNDVWAWVNAVQPVGGGFDLLVRPTNLQAGPMVASNGAVKSSLRVSGRPRVLRGIPVGPTTAPLPPFSQHADPQTRIQTRFELAASYQIINEELKRELVPHCCDQGLVDLSIRDVDLEHLARRIDLRLTVCALGGMHNIRVSGRLNYDRANGQLELDDVQVPGSGLADATRYGLRCCFHPYAFWGADATLYMAQGDLMNAVNAIGAGRVMTTNVRLRLIDDAGQAIFSVPGGAAVIVELSADLEPVAR